MEILLLYYLSIFQRSLMSLTLDSNSYPILKFSFPFNYVLFFNDVIFSRLRFLLNLPWVFFLLECIWNYLQFHYSYLQSTNQSEYLHFKVKKDIKFSFQTFLKTFYGSKARKSQKNCRVLAEYEKFYLNFALNSLS